MAFGTGTHETTQLCLQAIDKYFRGGSFIDVGTGTGMVATVLGVFLIPALFVIVERLSAETMPAVTVLSRPKGAPIATTHSPTRIAAGSPIVT